jgi:hypothetical protein
MGTNDLPVIQKTYDLIKWYIPLLNRLPRNHKFILGDRIITGLYNLLEGLITAQYAKEKLTLLLSFPSFTWERTAQKLRFNYSCYLLQLVI